MYLPLQAEIVNCLSMLQNFTFTIPNKYYIVFAFTFMHLADAFIQSDLLCIQVIHFRALIGQLSGALWLAEYLKRETEMLRPSPYW